MASSNERIEKTIKSLLKRAEEDQDILAVFLFGSHASNENTPFSDVDICLVMNFKTINFEQIKYSTKRLDYIKDFPFDIYIFQQLPLYIRKRVIKEGKVLLVKDEDLLYDLALRTARAFEDFKHIYHDYLQEVELDGSGKINSKNR